MTKYFFIFLILFSLQKVFSQNTFKTIIKDSSTTEILIGARASIKGTNNGALANEKGEIILSNILNDKGRALDYIYIERFWRALKYEHIYLNPANGGIELY